MKLTDIIKGSDYELSLFTDKQITELESKIVERTTKKGADYYVKCLIRKKEIKVTPEEIVRQLYLLVLTEDYGYPVSRMELEYGVTWQGKEACRHRYFRQTANHQSVYHR